MTQAILDEAAAIVRIPATCQTVDKRFSSSDTSSSRATGGKFDKSNPDISHPKQGGYTKEGAHQYERLAEAMPAHCEAALESASWGLGQVLGSNFKSAGFTDVEDMIEKMVESERHQLLGMFNFIASNKIGPFLKNHDWLNFALRYNGPNAEKEGYPLKLENGVRGIRPTSPPDIEVTARAARAYLPRDQSRRHRRGLRQELTQGRAAIPSDRGTSDDCTISPTTVLDAIVRKLGAACSRSFRTRVESSRWPMEVLMAPAARSPRSFR